MKIINDTLKVNGRWAHKRVLSFSSFWAGVAYAFTPIFFPSFEVHEFVVLCAFGLSAGCLGIDLHQKIKVQEEQPYNYNEQNNPLL